MAGNRKQDQKAKLDQWRAQQRAAARDRLPLSNEQMQAMFDMLEAELQRTGCDHTLRLVRQWAEADGLDFERIRAWCAENGGYCDCEVLANCEEAWREAMR